MENTFPSVSGAADMPLKPAGVRAGADSGDPQVASQFIYDDGTSKVGVWECTPGGWPIVDRNNTETVLVISGRGVISAADGSQQQLAPGAAVVLPKGW